MPHKIKLEKIIEELQDELEKVANDQTLDTYTKVLQASKEVSSQLFELQVYITDYFFEEFYRRKETDRK